MKSSVSNIKVDLVKKKVRQEKVASKNDGLLGQSQPSGGKSFLGTKVPDGTFRGAKRPVRQPRPAGSKGLQLARMRILIIDDDPARLDALAMALRELGAEVAVGDRFESGYSQASRLLPDAVVSDLAAPGDRGWLLVQRLRRHPILRWTPVLLFKWWNESEEGGHVLLDRVKDRLEEVLAPLRVLEERRTAHQSLSERLEITGPAGLLRFLIAERLRGMLVLNDTWSIFEICIDKGKLHSVNRRGLDDSDDKGEDAFFQFLLSDAGRWSFRYLTQVDTPKNIGDDFDKELQKASGLISDLFGPVGVSQGNLASKIEVDLKGLDSAYPTLTSTPKRVADAVRGGMESTSLEVLLEDFGDVHELARAIQFLFRCGSLRVRKNQAIGQAANKDGNASDAVARLLMAISDEYRAAEEISGEFDVESLPPEELIPLDAYAGSAERQGRYYVAEVEPEHLASKKTEKLNMPQVGNSLPPSSQLKDLEETTALGLEKGAATDSFVGALLMGSSGRETIPDGPVAGKLDDALDRGFLKGMIFDSLAPSPQDGERANLKQMWLAIGLALLLGAILVAGLVYIGSGGKRDGRRPAIESPKAGDRR